MTRPIRRACFPLLASLLLAAFSVAQAPDYAALAKQVVQDLSVGQFPAVEQQFNAQMAADVPATTLEAVWIRVEKRSGVFRSITSTTVKPDQGQRIVLVACQFAKGPLTVQLAFDSQGKITGLYFR